MWGELSDRICERGYPLEGQRLCVLLALILVFAILERVQTTVVDDFDHTSNTALVKHGRRRSGQRTVTEKDRSIIVLLSAIQLAINFAILSCQTYNCAASRIVKGRTRTKITVNKAYPLTRQKVHRTSNSN